MSSLSTPKLLLLPIVIVALATLRTSSQWNIVCCVESRSLPVFGTRFVQPLLSSLNNDTNNHHSKKKSVQRHYFGIGKGNSRTYNQDSSNTQLSSSITSGTPSFEWKDEVHDYFTTSSTTTPTSENEIVMEDDEEEDDTIPFTFNANIEENVLIHHPKKNDSLSSSSSSSLLTYKPPSFYKRVQNVIQSLPSPSEIYHNDCIQRDYGRRSRSISSRNDYISYSYHQQQHECRNRRRSYAINDDELQQVDNVMLKSLFQKVFRKSSSSTSSTQIKGDVCTINAPKEQVQEEEKEVSDNIQEPSPAILSGIIQPLIPTSIWNSLTGHEFYYPSVLSKLIQTGIQIATSCTSDFDQDESNDSCLIDWKPADSKTKKILAEHEEMGSSSTIRKALLDDDQVLVWIGKFKQSNAKDGYGSSLPLIKTTSVVPLSPKKFAELLMDSSQVPTYNKMSLGRKDVVVFQQGVDTECSMEDGDSGSKSEEETKTVVGQSFALNGEAKIVRNVTKPPLSKKLMEFVTLMYARKLKADDNVSSGYLGGGVTSMPTAAAAATATATPNSDNGSYIVVTRAVSGGRWSNKSNDNAVNTRGGGNGNDDEEEEMIRSEILLGVNLLRNIPGEPEKTEITAVTHVYSPSVPAMLAGSVGVKGAVDFIKDIRALCK